MAREFNGSSDRIEVTPSAALQAINDAFTIAFIGRRDNTANFRGIVSISDDIWMDYSATTLELGVGNNDWATQSYMDATTWILAGGSRPSGGGNVTARMHRLNMQTRVWTHGNGAGDQLPQPSVGSDASYIGNAFGTEWYDGLLALVAIWNRDLGDDGWVRLGACTVKAFLDSGPVALWVLDQADPAQTVVDLTGNGANQAGIAGTTIGALSVPILGYGADPVLIEVAADAGGTTHTKSGYGVAGDVGTGADEFTGVEAGAGTAGLTGSGADAFEATETAAGVAGLTAAGAKVREIAPDTGAGVAGLVGSGADTFEATETAAGVAGLAGAGADEFTGAETGAGVAALVAAGADVFEASEAAAGVARLLGSGADEATFNRAGFGTVGLAGSGESVYEPPGAVTYEQTGYAVAGLVGSGADVAEFAETGYATVGAVGAGSSAAGATHEKTGYATAGTVAGGADACEHTETGYATAGTTGAGHRAIVFHRTGYAVVQLTATGIRVLEYVEAGTGIAGLVAAGFSEAGVPTTNHWDAPSPAGALDPGSPTAGHWDAPTPEVVNT
jgi:hypothetical protein